MALMAGITLSTIRYPVVQKRIVKNRVERSIAHSSSYIQESISPHRDKKKPKTLQMNSGTASSIGIILSPVGLLGEYCKN